jgi:hypothetical protein
VKIDPQMEPLVRTAIDAAVKRSFDKLNAALRSFPNDDAVRKGVELSLAVCGFVMIDAHSGTPNDEQVRVVAEDIAEMEQWAEPTADEIHTFLSRLLSGQPLADQFSAESVIILAFIVTAALLASFHNPDEKWWDYLDRAEAVIGSRQST